MDGKVGINDYSTEIDGISSKEWCEVLNNFSDASIYQTWEYGAVRWGEKNLSHMVLMRDGQVISAAQVRIFKMPRFKIGMAYVFYGPMWKRNGKEDGITSFQAGLRALIDEYVIKRKLFLRLRPRGFDEIDDDMRSSLLSEGFRLTRGIYRNKERTILVDLRLSEDELRGCLKKGWRRSLLYAERANLKIVEEFDGRLFKQFNTLFIEMLERKKFKPGSDPNEFAQMQERLVQDHRMRITMCEAGGTPVAGIVSSALGEVVVGLLAATGAAGREVSAFYLLQWDEILWSKRAGKSFLDLGGINPETNAGVYHFKAGMNGQEVTFLGVFDFCRNRLLYEATIGFESLLRLRSRIIR